MDLIYGRDLLGQAQARSVGSSGVHHRLYWLPGGNLLIVVDECPDVLSVSAVVLTRADLQALTREAIVIDIEAVVAQQQHGAEVAGEALRRAQQMEVKLEGVDHK